MSQNPVIEMTGPSNAIDRGFLVAIILMGFCQWILPGSDPDVGTGSPLSNSLWIISYFIACTGLWSERIFLAKLMRSSMPLVAITILVVLSTFWSVDALATARRSFEMVGTSTIALFVVRRLGLKGFIKILAPTLAILGCISLFLVVLVPSFGTGDDGAWTGVFRHKNTLASAMLLGIVTISCTMAHSRGIRLLLQCGVLAVFLILLTGSKSTGTYVSGMIIGLLLPFIIWCRKRRKIPGALLPLLSVAIILTVLGILISGFDVDDALGFFGKDATLTGRTDVWRLALEAVQQRPALGYGYGVFWGSDGPAGTLVYPGISNHWEPGSAHNGFLEVALNIGLIGEVALICFLGLALLRAFTLFWRNGDGFSAWPLCAMIGSISLNLSEASFVAYNHMDWILFLASFFFATSAHVDVSTSQHAKSNRLHVAGSFS